MVRNREAGQALVFTALALTVLMGFAGLAIDMGVLRYDKRLQQSAADAGAIAGANNLQYDAVGSTGVITGAQTASAKNGFTDNGSGQVSNCTSASAAIGTVCVQVNNPPAAGPHAGNNKYVEVLVSAVQPTFFMKVFGVAKETITARAVATNVSGGGPNSGCLYTLGPPNAAIEGVNITGSATLNAPTCGINDDGNYDPTGGTVNLIINAGTFGVVGSDTGHGGNVTCTSQPAPCPAYGMPTAADPLSYLTAPSQPSASLSCPSSGLCSISTSGTTTLQPGTYASIKFGKNSTTTLSPGLYYINNADGSGGLIFDGKASVTGTGVMFYLTCPPGTTTFPCTNGATVGATGGGNVPDITLTAMTTAQATQLTGTSEYAGILFYQDPHDTAAPSLGGDDQSFFNGALYFPTVELSFFGNAKGTGYTAGIVVAKALSLTGNPTVNLIGTAGLPPGVSILTNTVLVE
jgi:hypothetical protein